MNLAARWKYLVITLGTIGLYFLATPLCVSRPVVLELFTTRGDPNCKNAEDAVRQLRDEYSPDRLLLLVFHRNDSLEINAGVSRYRQYNIRQLPAVVFNGTVRIEGGNQTAVLYNSYRNNIENQLRIESEGAITGWMRFSQGELVTSAIVTMPTISRSLNLVFALTQTHSTNQFDIVRYVETIGLVADEVTSAVRVVAIPDPIIEVGANTIWFIQDRDTKEIIQSGPVANRSPLVADLTGDGLLNQWDVFFLASVWGSASAIVDLNRNQRVDVHDLLLFLGPE
ncbi:MAG: hypothetical protein C4527_24310 [Candidatus Omnitrophota bacterium]|nr:MAG: hypothetical protein C4527_24310 [Candidatus Omnitrophota bacterium]